ncbi:hypothetical protein BGW38_010928 [Lunasporangiospora selenospora]|uniref:Short-chain dehydrogenase/reductase 3 n=1 Tax=Lunasporangiospora selenospora TaxID=979761 RepID=A0A9P6KFD9_9FUNG|nr:hypothetical protein BGW38_010928 [Lunasporangiospora selenospora]
MKSKNTLRVVYSRKTIDFVVQMLKATVFHLSFPFFIIPCIKLYGVTNESLAFNIAAIYGVILIVIKTAIAFHQRKQRQGDKIEWDDEIVLITGGASGIGLLLAESLAIRRVSVVVLDVKHVETASDIDSYICDVSNPAEIARVAAQIREDVGEPTIIVNNAGIVIGKSILDLSTDDIKKTMDVNFLGQAFIIKEFLPNLIKNNHGHIITLSSVMGITSAPKVADYCASKAAVKSFHEALESEIKYVYKTPGVKTTLVCPARVETGMFKGVRERLPFFTPALEPLQVVCQIMETMEQRRGRNQIMMPFFVNLVPLVSILPFWVTDLAQWASGANTAMDTFEGRGTTSENTANAAEAESRKDI